MIQPRGNDHAQWKCAISGCSSKLLTQQYIRVYDQPVTENMGNHPSKAHSDYIHKHVRPYYVQMANSPRELPRAARPSYRRGNVEILGNPYHKRIPFPVFQSTTTLTKTPNWWNRLLRLWSQNIYLDVGVHKSCSLYNTTVCVHDYRTLDSRTNLYLAPYNIQYLATSK